jgi:excisionase family DNA binding protein
MVKEYLTLRQAAAYLKVTDSVIKEMTKSKVFKAKKVGNTYKVEKAEVDEWLANLNEREVEHLALKRSGKGVALLHPRHFHPSKIKKPSIIFGRSSDGIEFDAIDNKPVDLFFMLLLHDDVQHLFSISYISKLLMNEDILKTLSNAHTKEEIVTVLTKNVLK